MSNKTREGVDIDNERTDLLEGGKRKSKRRKGVAREDREDRAKDDVSSGDAEIDNLTASLSSEARNGVRKALGDAIKAITEAEKKQEEREKRLRFLRRSGPITGCFGGEPTRRDGCFGKG